MNTNRNELRDVGRVLWMPLVCAIPLAMALGSFADLGWLGYRIAYKFGLAIAYPVALCGWLAHRFLVPRLAADMDRAWRNHVIPALCATFVGTLAGASALEWIQPGLLGGPSGVAEVVGLALAISALALLADHAERLARRVQDSFGLARQPWLRHL